jgi:surface protein
MLKKTLKKGRTAIFANSYGVGNTIVPVGAKHLVFTDKIAPLNPRIKKKNMTENGHRIVGWMDGDVYYISSQRKGKKVVAPTDSSDLFAFAKLVTIDVSMLDVGGVVSMDGMFRMCHNLTNIFGLETWDTSHVTNMDNMFQSDWYLSNEMFDSLADWNTENVATMKHTFAFCESITNLRFLRKWDVSHVTSSLEGTFAYCKNLVTADGLQDWDVSSAITLAALFDSCENLTDISALRKWNVSTVLYMSGIFRGCERLTSDAMMALASWHTSEVRDLNYAFVGCHALTNLDFLSQWDVSKVQHFERTFAACHELTDHSGVDGWNISKNSWMWDMFCHCTNLHSTPDWYDSTRWLTKRAKR